MPDGNVSDTTADSVVSEQVKVTPKPEETVSYWQNKYNGFKGWAEKELTKRDDQVSRLTEMVGQYEGNVTNVTRERDTFKTQVEQSVSTITDLNEKLTGVTRTLEVGKVISAKYPTLAELFTEGFLAVGDRKDSELDTFLAAAAAKLQKARRDTATDDLDGAPPPTPKTQPSPAATNLGAITEAMNTALRSHGARSTEYQEQFDIYMAALNEAAKNGKR